MVLTYYLDNSLDPVPTGNAFGKVLKVHTLLNWHPRWQYLSPNEMRRKIVTAFSLEEQIRRTPHHPHPSSLFGRICAYPFVDKHSLDDGQSLSSSVDAMKMVL